MVKVGFAHEPCACDCALYIFERDEVDLGCITGSVSGAFDMKHLFAEQDQHQGNTLQKLLGSLMQHESAFTSV